MKFIRIKMKFVVVSMLFFIFILPTGAQTANNCYAVLLNGGINDNYNYIGHYEGLAFIYNTLINEYNYNESQVFVLNSDGTSTGDDAFDFTGEYGFPEELSSPQDLDGDNDNDIDAICNIDEIEDVFYYLENNLTTNDFLFIFITGANDLLFDNLYYLWDNPQVQDLDYISDSDIADLIDQVDAGRIVVLSDYDKAGTIIDNIEGSNRVVFSSCASNEGSPRTDGQSGYDEYTYNFFSAMAGRLPENFVPIVYVDADDNGDGYISLKEAHLFAINNKTAPINYNPQYSTAPYNLWENMTLLGEELCASVTNIHDDYFYSGSYHPTENCIFDLEDVLIFNGASLYIEAEVDIIIKSNVLIEEDSNLILEADNSVIIHSDFGIELGSTLSIY